MSKVWTDERLRAELDEIEQAEDIGRPLGALAFAMRDEYERALKIDGCESVIRDLTDDLHLANNKIADQAARIAELEAQVSQLKSYLRQADVEEIAHLRAFAEGD